MLYFLCLLSLSSLYAQELNFLNPNGPQTLFEIDQSISPIQKLKKSPDQTKVNFTNLGLGHTLKEGKNALTLGARSQKLDLSAQDPMLDDYYNIQGSLNYRRMMEDGNFWSLNGSFGSASNRPFRNGRDGTIGLTYLQKFNPRWFGVLNYSNNRPFLNNVPLPGAFWVKELHPRKTLVLGFPFIVWVTPLSEKFSFKYIGVLPWMHRARILYHAKSFDPYIAWEQAPLNYFRHGREKRRDRFFWFERKLGVGVEGQLGRSIRYDLSSGLAYDRQFFEARNFSEKKKNLKKLSDGLFAALQLKFAF